MHPHDGAFINVNEEFSDKRNAENGVFLPTLIKLNPFPIRMQTASPSIYLIISGHPGSYNNRATADLANSD